MAQPFIGEIRIFAGNFAPTNWMFCEGQTLAISEYSTLFNLIGTTYGGNGQSTFSLPDLRGRVPVHQGTDPGMSTYVMGQQAGVEDVTLTSNQLPAHTHPATVSGASGSLPGPAGHLLAASDTAALYTAAAPNVALGASSIAPSGGSQPHNNLQPFLCLSFIIALFGIYPSQS